MFGHDDRENGQGLRTNNKHEPSMVILQVAQLSSRSEGLRILFLLFCLIRMTVNQVNLVKQDDDFIVISCLFNLDLACKSLIKLLLCCRYNNDNIQTYNNRMDTYTSWQKITSLITPICLQIDVLININITVKVRLMMKSYDVLYHRDHTDFRNSVQS